MNKTKKPNNTGGIIFAFFAVILVTAYLTNPKEEIHRERLENKLTEVIDDIMAERQDDLVAYSAWKLGGSLFVRTFVDHYVTVDNYYLCSLTRLHWEGETYIVGIGGYGNVYITKRLNRELAESSIDHIEQMVIDSLPDFMK